MKATLAFETSHAGNTARCTYSAVSGPLQPLLSSNVCETQKSNRRFCTSAEFEKTQPYILALLIASHSFSAVQRSLSAPVELCNERVAARCCAGCLDIQTGQEPGGANEYALRSTSVSLTLRILPRQSTAVVCPVLRVVNFAPMAMCLNRHS